MTVTNVAMVPDATLTTSDEPYYTCPVNTSAQVKRAVFTNTSTSAVTVTVNVVRNGGTSTTTNVLIPAKPVAPNDTYVAPELAGLALAAGDAIHAFASTGGVINFMVSGIQIV